MVVVSLLALCSKRNEVGLMVKKKMPLQMGGYWAVLLGVAGLVGLAFVKYSWLEGGFVVCAAFGFIFGYGLGVGRGLPIVPFFIFTILDSGVYVRVTRKREFPCMYRCKHFPGLHYRDEVIILFVDDDFKLLSLLKGIPVQPIKA